MARYANRAEARRQTLARKQARRLKNTTVDFTDLERELRKFERINSVRKAV